MRTESIKTHFYQTHTKEKDKKQFLQEQTKCPICCGELDIFVECVSSSCVKEEARCTQCRTLSRVQHHCVH